ncbi:MAG: hypothetical protein HYT62_00580 [Candidatus Yanofskybacteria bacterium]|nr:hypothetical protein [Candidatus Yanofskybacteria bacterium]
MVTSTISSIFGKKAINIEELRTRIDLEREKLKIPKNIKIKIVIGRPHEYWVDYTHGITNHFELSVGSDMHLASAKHEVYHIYRLIKLGCPKRTLLKYIREEFLAEVYCFTNLDITRLLMN